MSERRKATMFIALAVACLGAGFLTMPWLGIFAVGTGFAGYVYCGRQAMRLWHVDERVFLPPRFWRALPGVPSAVEAGLLLGSIGPSARAPRARFGRGARSVSDDVLSTKPAATLGVPLLDWKGRDSSTND